MMPPSRATTPPSPARRRTGGRPACPSAALAFLVLLTPAALAPAQTAPATTQQGPAAAGAAIPTVQSTPARTLVAYSIAMAAGDVEGVRSAFHADAPAERAVADAYAHLAEAVRGLRAAATARFGPDGFDNIGFGRMFAEDIKRLESTRLQVDGDTALAFMGKGDRPDMALVRTPDGWKISVARSFPNPARRVARTEAQAKAFTELAAEIEQGRHRLATDALVAGRRLVADAMAAADQQLKQQEPATRPAPDEDGG